MMVNSGLCFPYKKIQLCDYKKYIYIYTYFFTNNILINILMQWDYERKLLTDYM